MNPLPYNLHHLEALFDHYNLGHLGHFIGESSPYFLSTQPTLPILTPHARHSSSSNANAQDHLHSTRPPCPFNTTSTATPAHPSHNTTTPSTGTRSGRTSRAYGCDAALPAVARSSSVLSQLAPPRLARELVKLFMTKVNCYIPILPSIFLEEFDDPHTPPSPLLLLSIFAIASKYSTDPFCRSDPTRAQTAGEPFCLAACRLVDDFLDSPRLSTVQALFLLGKYLEGSKLQSLFSKGYMYAGMAVRMGLDLGLNRNCSGWGLSPPALAEYRNRTWWCLYVYDRTQSASYGRPFLIQDRDCCAEKPRLDGEAKDQATDQIMAEHLSNLIHLTMLLGKIIVAFYPANSTGCNHCLPGQSQMPSGSGMLYNSSTSASTGMSTRADEAGSPVGVPGPRKRTKMATTSIPTTGESAPSKSRTRGQEEILPDKLTGGFDESPNLNFKIGATNATGPRLSIPRKTLAQREMLIRQRFSNQRQDQLVMDLDKELAEWVQGLPPHLQWNTLQTTPNLYGDIIHALYYAILILLHRPSIRVGELLPITPTSKQETCPFEQNELPAMEGCHSMTVCSQAAGRITTLAERCSNISHIERFGAGSFVLLHAARVHLICAAVPAPPRCSSVKESHLCEPNPVFVQSIRRRDRAIDQFHRTLGSLRKFSIYHWTLNGISVSLRSLERTLAAILHEQENDQGMDSRKKKTGHDNLDSTNAPNVTHWKEPSTQPGQDTAPRILLASAKDDHPQKSKGEAGLNASTVSGNKSGDELLHERTYYENMRLFEMRLLYQQRHTFSKGNHLEEHSQRQDPKSSSYHGINLAPRQDTKTSSDSTEENKTRESSLNNLSVLFSNNVLPKKSTNMAPSANATAAAASNPSSDLAPGPNTPKPSSILSAPTVPPSSSSSPPSSSSSSNLPGLIIRAYKPNTAGRPRKRSNTVQFAAASVNVSVRSKTPSSSISRKSLMTPGIAGATLSTTAPASNASAKGTQRQANDDASLGAMNTENTGRSNLTVADIQSIHSSSTTPILSPIQTPMVSNGPLTPLFEAEDPILFGANAQGTSASGVYPAHDSFLAEPLYSALPYYTETIGSSSLSKSPPPIPVENTPLIQSGHGSNMFQKGTSITPPMPGPAQQHSIGAAPLMFEPLHTPLEASLQNSYWNQRAPIQSAQQAMEREQQLQQLLWIHSHPHDYQWEVSQQRGRLNGSSIVSGTGLQEWCTSPPEQYQSRPGMAHRPLLHQQPIGITSPATTGLHQQHMNQQGSHASSRLSPTQDYPDQGMSLLGATLSTDTPMAAAANRPTSGGFYGSANTLAAQNMILPDPSLLQSDPNVTGSTATGATIPPPLYTLPPMPRLPPDQQQQLEDQLLQEQVDLYTAQQQWILQRQRHTQTLLFPQDGVGSPLMPQIPLSPPVLVFPGTATVGASTATTTTLAGGSGLETLQLKRQHSLQQPTQVQQESSSMSDLGAGSMHMSGVVFSTRPDSSVARRP